MIWTVGLVGRLENEKTRNQLLSCRDTNICNLDKEPLSSAVNCNIGKELPLSSAVNSSYKNKQYIGYQGAVMHSIDESPTTTSTCTLFQK